MVLNSGNNSNRLLRVDQVATRLNCSKRHVYLLIESGKLQALRIGKSRGIRIPEQAVDEFIAKQIENFME